MCMGPVDRSGPRTWAPPCPFAPHPHRSRGGNPPTAGGSIGALCSLGLMVVPVARDDAVGMNAIASAPSPISRATRRDGSLSADVERTSPSGQALFYASADMLAAARGLDALAEAARRADMLLSAAGACSEAGRTASRKR
jgi:hypothetical protein